MSTKLRKILFITISVVLVFVLSFAIFTTQIFPKIFPAAPSQAILSAQSFDNGVGLPTYLVIPKINVKAEVQSVGITTNGEMDVPKDELTVVWYEFGFRPGDMGNAVIAGHTNGRDGEAGVFASLGSLSKDDEVYVKDDMGVTRVFKVLDSRELDPGYADEVFSQSDGVYLNLVTCSGIWDSKRNIYSKRLVVFTQLKSVI